MKKIGIPIIILVFACSCDAYLSTTPDLRTELNTKEKIQQLLVTAYPDAAYPPFLDPMTDNAEDTSPSSGTPTDQINTAAYFWKEIDFADSDSYVQYWSSCYSAIAAANQALASVKELPQDKGTDAIRAEALLCRAYAHLMLVSMWANSYDPTTASTDKGIPYVTEVEDVAIKQYQRNSVEQVYSAIEKDIVEGIKITENTDSYYEKPLYHFNKQAAYALANRFYLYKGDWDKVLEYGNKIFAGNDPSLSLRNWKKGEYKQPLARIERFYSSISEPCNLLLNSVGSLYDRTYEDVRYRMGFSLFSELFRGNNPSGGDWVFPTYSHSDYSYFVPKYEEYFKYTNRESDIGYPFVTFVLLSVDEVFLNNIEAKIMKGMNAEALDDLDVILEKNTIDPYTKLENDKIKQNYGLASDKYSAAYTIPAAGSDGYALLDVLLELRRRIFWGEGLRWFDIKRYHIRVLHKDYLRNEFVLEPNSPKRLLQIPSVATSRGIEPNPR